MYSFINTCIECKIALIIGEMPFLVYLYLSLHLAFTILLSIKSKRNGSKGWDMKRIISAGLGMFVAASAFASSESIYAEELPVVWSSIVTLSGGPVWTQPGQNQYLYPQPVPAYNYFTYNTVTGNLATAEIFFGLQHVLPSCLIGELGIGAAGATDAKVIGEIAVNGVPDVRAYQYKINHGRLEMKGRLISTYFNPVQPYVSASLGAGFNNSHDYRPTSINETLYPSSWFLSKTVLGLSYTFGAGLQKNISPNWQVGMGYEFADWGNNYLGGDQQTLYRGPGMAHLFTHELLFSLSYLY
jgi:hypothetical protein